MRRSAQLDGATIRRDLSFAPSAEEWATLSAIVPSELLEGDREVITDLAELYLTLAEAEAVAPTRASAVAKIDRIAKSAKALQDALSYGCTDEHIDVAKQISSLMDAQFERLALRRGSEAMRLHDVHSVAGLILEATDLAKRGLETLAPIQGSLASQQVLFGGLKEFFEDHRWPVSFTYDCAPSEDRHPTFVRFASVLLLLLPSHRLIAQHHELTSLGRRMSRACAA